MWWFGGGMDLTPYYAFEEDVRALPPHVPRRARAVRRRALPRYKRWCDEYFFLRHRNEPRGVGGIFFDDVNEPDFDTCFALVRSVGEHFLPAYVPIVERRRDMPYGERERDFQAYRRGRYVEFNLVYDRGTLFGLQSGGRTESILMSMPPRRAVALRLEARARARRKRGSTPSSWCRGTGARVAGPRLARTRARPRADRTARSLVAARNDLVDPLEREQA